MYYGDLSPWMVSEKYGDYWQDAELNSLFRDLFGNNYEDVSEYNRSNKSRRKMEFGRVWRDDKYTGGLAETLDLYREGDIDKETYLEQVKRFKRKWLKRNDKDIVNFYVDHMEGVIDGMRKTVIDEIKRYSD